MSRSFARRIGRTLSVKGRKLLESSLQDYTITETRLNEIRSSFSKVHLEIGFGKGENLIAQAKENPSTFYIGAEVYLNSICSLLEAIVEHNISNIGLWQNDVLELLEFMPKEYLNEIYILFPDPWPKRKQSKRRLVNQKTLLKLHSLSIVGGSIYFASDIADYVQEVRQAALTLSEHFLLEENLKPTNYIKTKYNLKAEKEGRTAEFLRLMIKSI